VDGFGLLDNRRANRQKAEQLDTGKPVSRKLLKCRTTKDFVNFARNNGAKTTHTKSNRVKVTKNGVTTGFHQVGEKTDLDLAVRKQKIEASYKPWALLGVHEPVGRSCDLKLSIC